MSYRMIQVGAGGWGSYWCNYFLPESMKDGLIEVVALVDVDEEALTKSREPLGLLLGGPEADGLRPGGAGAQRQGHRDAAEQRFAHGCHGVLL